MRLVSRWSSVIAATALVGTSFTLAVPAMAEELPVDDQQVVVTETVDETVSEESTDTGSLGEEASTEEEVISEDVAEEAVEEVTEPAAEPVAEEVPSISEIRALEDNSPVTTRGWVTGAWPTGGMNGFTIQTEGTGGACDFAGESDAIFVYTNHSNNIAPTPEVGTYVEITGTLKTFSGLRQIDIGPAKTAPERITVIEDTTGIELAEAITCEWPATDAERNSVQSMLYMPISADGFAVTNNYNANSFGELGISVTGAPLQQPSDVTANISEREAIEASNAANLILLDDGATTRFAGGNATNNKLVPPYVSATGEMAVGAIVEFNEPVIFDYRNNAWKLNPTYPVLTSTSGVVSPLPVSFTHERPAAPGNLGGDVVVGGFNLENYFPTTLGADWAAKFPGAGCTSYNDNTGQPVAINRCSDVTVDGLTVSNPRGAWDQVNLNRQSNRLVTAINQLDASALGVMELENSYKMSFGDADKAGASAAYLVNELNKAAGYAKWDYVNPDPEKQQPIANQDVMYPGIIYQPEKVTAIEGGQLTLNNQSGEGQAFSNARAPFGQLFEPADGGKPFFLVANHFKSKSGSGAGDNADTGEGGWNGDRTRQAEALINWVNGEAKTALKAATDVDVEDILLVGDFNSYTFEKPMTTMYKAGFQNVNVINGKPEAASYNYSGLNGSLDHVIVSDSVVDRATGHAIWNINAPEQIGLHYSRYNYTGGEFVQKNWDKPARSSDHDPAVVGLLAAEEVAPPVDPDHDVRRLAGKDRYGTNLAVNEALGYAKGGTVIVATGANYADALSAAPAAAIKDGALFLTSKGSLTSATLAEIKNLEPSRVYVIGGTVAISSKVVTQLRDATGVFPLRIAGADRYETSAKIFQTFFSGSTVPTAFVATGQDFPDALSASAAAGALEGPVILVNGKTGKNLMSESTALLKRLGTENILITGGPVAVNNTIEANLSKAFPNVQRLQGKDRYATNMAVNVYLNKHAGSVPMTGVWIATGKNFPDALTAAPAAGHMTQRLVLTNGVCIPKPVVSKWINGPGSQVEMTTLVGGPKVLPEALMALPECGGTAGTTTEVTLLNINDFHGRIDGTLNADDSALTASSTVNFGYTVDSLRNDAGWDNSLFLSAGDNVGATLFASALAQDQPTIDLLNALGLEASAVGNHEFDAGWADLRDRLTSEFNGVLLGANVYKEGTTRPLLPEYAMLDAAGLKVAVIGVVTEDTPTLVNPANVAGVTFGDPVEAVQRVAAKLEALPLAERPDLIVAEYHEGASGVSDATTLEGMLAAGGIFARIVEDTPASVDAIFNGHTHQKYTWNGPIPGTDRTRPIVSTASYGANIGKVVLDVDSTTHDVVGYNMELVNVADYTAGMTIDEMVAENPVMNEVYGITLEALQVAKIEGEVPVGQITQTLSRDYTKGVYVDGKWQKGDSGAANNRDGESPMGTLVGNMLRDGQMSQLPKAPDFGVTNPGGLRTDFDYGTDGVLTVAEARAVLPFNNNLSVVEMTGEQIVTMLEQQWQRDAEGNVPSRSYLQLGLSDNVSYTYHEIDDPAKAGFKLGVIDSVTIDGVALDPAATYNVGTFEFLAAGGDNFWVFKDGVVTDTGLVDWESWLAYLSAASGKTGEGAAVTFSTPIAPDFARRGVAVDGVPADGFVAGEEVTLTFRNIDVHAVGAPANTKLDVTLGGVSVGSFDITNEQLANGNWTDKAVVTFTVPAGYTEGALVATAVPTNTEAIIY